MRLVKKYQGGTNKGGINFNNPELIQMMYQKYPDIAYQAYPEHAEQYAPQQEKTWKDYALTAINPYQGPLMALGELTGDYVSNAEWAPDWLKSAAKNGAFDILAATVPGKTGVSKPSTAFKEGTYTRVGTKKSPTKASMNRNSGKAMDEMLTEEAAKTQQSYTDAEYAKQFPEQFKQMEAKRADAAIAKQKQAEIDAIRAKRDREANLNSLQREEMDKVDYQLFKQIIDSQPQPVKEAYGKYIKDLTKKFTKEYVNGTSQQRMDFDLYGFKSFQPETNRFIKTLENLGVPDQQIEMFIGSYPPMHHVYNNK